MASIVIVHRKRSISTISGLVSSNTFQGSGLTIGRFVATKNSDGVTNLERIYSKYNCSDFGNDTSFEIERDQDIALLRSLNDSAIDSFNPVFNKLMIGTQLVINSSDIHRNMNIPDKTTDRFYNSSPFMDEIIKALMDDEDFVDIVGLNDNGFGVIDKNPQATVWVWTKSLGNNGYLTGRLLNISPFVKGINLDKQRLSGSFSVDLSYVFDKLDIPDVFTVSDNVINSLDSSGKRRRNLSQFHSMISKNDIVFIRLSRLKLEKDVPNTLKLDDLQPSDIPGRIYDIIGLIDRAGDVTDGGSGEVSASIVGQDLTKLLSDDGSSIYQSRYTSAGNTPEEVGLSEDIFRLFGQTVSMMNLVDTTIDIQMQYIIDYMTRSKICDGLFDYYPADKRRTNKIQLPDGSTINAENVKGIWQIISVGVDESIAGYNTYNSRLGNDYSSILAQLSSVCQEPFVDLYTDTYGDQFKIMARRPIFDKSSVMFYSKSETTKTVHEFDIIDDSLDYDDRVYSWYRLDPKYTSSGISPDDFKWLLPSKYFQEYADIFGDKPMQVVNPYVKYEMAEANDKKSILLNKNQLIAHINDYKFLIETHAYLPFTRKGVITVTGNRTYKRGTWFYNEGTDEMYYIDAVSHRQAYSSGGTEYATTLTVSRGMVRSILDKYFSIINMPIQDFTGNNIQAYLESTIISWLVNVDVFNYFISRKQWNKVVTR